MSTLEDVIEHFGNNPVSRQDHLADQAMENDNAFNLFLFQQMRGIVNFAKFVFSNLRRPKTLGRDCFHARRLTADGCRLVEFPTFSLKL